MIRLTKRDFEIIDYLKNEGWALSTQLAGRFFDESRHTCANRLKQLIAGGIVEGVNLSQFRRTFWHERALLNIFCDLNGRTRVYRLSETIRGTLGQRHQRASSDFMLAHQILLGAIRNRLEAEFPDIEILSEASEAMRLQHLKFSSDELPDLVLNVGDKKIAVELERKARRGLALHNAAYEDRFVNLTLQYDLILYIVENETSLSGLLRKADGLSQVGICSILSMNEIFRPGFDTASLKSFITGEAHRTTAKIYV